MELLLSSVEIILRFDVMVALLIGSVGGVIIGAIPGVGPAIAIAILLPATFAFEPIVGLTLLLGIYGSSMYGGAIPAILINTPGTPINAMTTYDGYPMTQKGEPHRGLSLAYGASFFGGMFSVIVLMLFSPVLAKVAPMFGSREIFMATLLGMVLVVVAHRGRTVAAGALLFFGIFLQTVGLEPLHYTSRYTFGQSALTSGFDLIVVVLGLFAISQAFLLLSDHEAQPETPELKSGLRTGFLEVLRYPRVLVSSASYGTMMGIIPGVGEFIAQFLSYTTARKGSKTPELFGKGAPEGVVATETANNAVPAAAMIPLLALGIPGESLTAMMLSVFYVHNVLPGPQLFANDMDFVFAIYLSLLLLNILAFVFLIFATRYMVRVIEIPSKFLGMSIMALSFVGVYSLRNSFFDCFLAAVFGLLGLVLKRLNLPIVPIILGMVLGGIMETKFRSSLSRIDGPLDWINRPIAGILFGLIIAILLSHFYTMWKARQIRRQEG